jgi:GcrA cell cycle regulator
MLQASITSPRAPGNGPGWTDARTEHVKALWAEGRPASEIAGLLGEVTRNAVIGKVHRLGLSGRKTSSRQPVPCRTSPRRGKSGRVERHLPPARFVRPASPMPPTPPSPVAALMLPLRQLRDDQCRWPIGDPRKAGFGFCGCQKAPGVPYCAHHSAIAYNPAARRGRTA